MNYAARRYIVYALIISIVPLFAVLSELDLIEKAGFRQYLFLIVSTILLLLFSVKIIKKAFKATSAIPTDKMEENKWLRYAYDNNDEMIILLNQYGQILTFNKAFIRTLYYQKNELIGHPFRNLIHPDFSNRRIHEKFLTKLKEVFEGNETRFICSCKRNGDNEPVPISFRMIPIIEANDVTNILVIGSLHHADNLTKNYLTNESSNYIINNDLSIIFLLCHRLTRNLEDRLPKNTILMAQVALQEVFMNAIEHGNLEISYERKTQLKAQKENYWELLLRECNKDHLKHRKIYVSYYMDKNQVVYTIRDEGKGFDWKKFFVDESSSVRQDIVKNYHGVGLEIVKSVFKVSFNDAGNEITLTKDFPARTQ